MAGIYIHIPFCRKACHYCNFHFSTQLNQVNEMVDAICLEIQTRQTFLNEQPIETIYFGGGTPSLLELTQLEKIIQLLLKTFDCSNLVEFTLEANPEDISKSKLQEWQQLGINRLSIGVQSFFDEDLKYMNRNHDARTSKVALDLCKSFGPEMNSIDLIFGSHTTTNKMWAENLNTFFSYGFQHLSAYGLTVEENTALSHFIKKGRLATPDDDKSSTQFLTCMDMTAAAAYNHYEISNYALAGFEAVHNTNYWNGVPYLGLGPSAHSYDGVARYWTESNNQAYLKSMANGDLKYGKEVLSAVDKFNEWIMTGLRHQGILISDLELHDQQFKAEFEHTLASQLAKGNVNMNAGKISLTQIGKLISDHVTSEFFATNT